MRVIVTGSRTWTNPVPILRDLEAALATSGYSEPFAVVHGAARGADQIAARWVQMRHLVRVTAEPHPADWERLGRAAGVVRNRAMVAAGADLCLAYIRDRSPGATHCANTARAAGIETRITEWPAGVT